MFNENRSCIEISAHAVKNDCIARLMKTEVVLKLSEDNRLNEVIRGLMKTEVVLKFIF